MTRGKGITLSYSYTGKEISPIESALRREAVAIPQGTPYEVAAQTLFPLAVQFTQTMLYFSEEEQRKAAASLTKSVLQGVQIFP